MSVSARAADTCASCRATLPAGARICPECGATVDDLAGATLRVEVPPEETGPVPVSFSQAEPRWFGVPPPALLLTVAAACAVAAVALFATGGWPYGLILLGVAALLLAAFLELARRRPGQPAGGAPADVRGRAESAWETWRARASVAAESRRIRYALLAVESERRAALLELGAAAHGGDAAREQDARARLAALDGREAELQRRLQEQVELTAERIRRARLPVQETVMVTPPGPSAPYPPPDEGNPPQPPLVPEPYPPPDEGNPPQPAPAPEPRPDDS
jgi:hypothetical protein